MLPRAVDTTKNKRSSSSRSGSRKREKSLPRISQGVRLNAFPDPPNERYVSMFDFKVGGRAGKRRLTEEIDELTEERFISVLRIIQIRQHERRRNCPSISQMCDLALDLEYIADDIVLELMDYVKMVKINGPRLDYYLKEMEMRRYDIGLEQFCDSYEEVREKRNMHRENNIIITVNPSEPKANGASERVVLKPVSKQNSLSKMTNLRCSSKNESEEHRLPKKRGWGQNVDISMDNEISHRSIKSSRTSMPKSEQNAKPFEQRKSDRAAKVEANDVEKKRMKLDRSRSRTDARTESSRSSDRVESAAEPNKKPGYGQKAFASIFNKFFGPDDDDEDSRRPVEKKRSDNGVRLAESKTIRSSCATEQKRSSERAKSLAEPRVPRSSRAPENEKKRSTESMAARSLSSPRNQKKSPVESMTTRSSRTLENQKKRPSDRVESLPERKITRSSRALEDEKKKKKAAQPMASRSFSSPRQEKKPTVEPTTSRSTRNSEKEKKRLANRAKSVAQSKITLKQQEEKNQKEKMARLNERITRLRSARAAQAGKYVKVEKHVVVDPKKVEQCVKVSNGNDAQDRKSRSSALYEEIRVSTAQAKAEQVRRSIRIADEKEREKHDKVSSFHKCIEFDSFDMAGMLDTSSGKAEKSQKQNNRHDDISSPEYDVAEDQPVRFAPAPTASVMKQKIRINYKMLRPRQIGPVTQWEKWCYDLILDLRDDIRTSFYYKLDDIKRIFGPSRDFIKSPIDFETIENKLEYRLYVSLDEVKRDFDLIRINNFGSGKLGVDTAGYAYEETLFWLWSKCPFLEDIRGIPNPEVVDDSDMNPLLVNELVEDVPTVRPKFTFTEEAMWKRTGPLVLRNVSSVPKRTDATRFDDQVVLAPQQEVLDMEAASWQETGPLVVRNVSSVQKRTDATRFDDQVISAPQQEVLDTAAASWEETGPLVVRNVSGVSALAPKKTDATRWDDQVALAPQQEYLDTEAASWEETGPLVVRNVSRVPKKTDATRWDDQVALALQQEVLDTETASWTGPLALPHASDVSETLEKSALDPDENTVWFDDDDVLFPQQEVLDADATWLNDNTVSMLPNNDSDQKSLLVNQLAENIVSTPQYIHPDTELDWCAQSGPVIVPDISYVSHSIDVETTKLDDVIVPMFEPVTTQHDLEIEETRLLDRLDSSPITDVALGKVLVDMETQTSEDLVVDRAVRRTKSAVQRPHVCRCTCGSKRSASEMSSSEDIEAPPKKNLKHYFPVVSGGKKMELTMAVVAPPRKTLRHYFSVVSK